MWYPRDENCEADALTNSKFEGFDDSKRVPADKVLSELTILNEILILGRGFEKARANARRTSSAPPVKRGRTSSGVGRSAPQHGSKRARLEGEGQAPKGRRTEAVRGVQRRGPHPSVG